MGRQGISWETQNHLKVGPSKTRRWKYTLRGHGPRTHLLCRIHVNCKVFLTEELVVVLVNVLFREQETNKEKWGSDTKYYQGLGEKRTNCGWYSIGRSLVYLSPIQYLITFGVNRLNGDDGRCVLTIRQGTYSKRPALLSDIKYWFGKIDLNSGRIKRALWKNQWST